MYILTCTIWWFTRDWNVTIKINTNWFCSRHVQTIKRYLIEFSIRYINNDSSRNYSGQLVRSVCIRCLYSMRFNTFNQCVFCLKIRLYAIYIVINEICILGKKIRLYANSYADMQMHIIRGLNLYLCAICGYYNM